MNEKKVIEITQKDLIEFIEYKGYNISGYRYTQFQAKNEINSGNNELIILSTWYNKE